MKYKSLVIICLTAFLLSIICVSATDVNNTTISNGKTEIISYSQEDMLTVADDNGTFTSLQNKISNASNGDTITLDRDYTYDEGFNTVGIVIDKYLTIDGNGHTLNGLSKSRIILINLGKIAPNKVTIKNLKFINGNTNLYGGAIFNYADLKIDNCQFTNNYAKYCGGAINSVGNLECMNSKFDKNIANGDGGAIFTFSLRGTLANILKKTINATLNGNMDFIAVLINDQTLIYKQEYITNCVFTENVARGRGGGAVYAFGHIDIKKSTFTSNKANEEGGAVFANQNLYISDSKFTNNHAPTYGGAVYFKCPEQGGHYENKKWVSQIKYYSNSITKSVFTKNSAGRGGAIYGFRASDEDTLHCVKASKCTFEDNKALKGRDIYGGTASNCIFNYLKLTLKSVKIKKSAKKLVLTAKLTKGKTLIKGKKITFKFNGKTYKAKTNKKGIAKVTIKKNIVKKLKVGKKVKYQAKYDKLTVKKKLQKLKNR